MLREEELEKWMMERGADAPLVREWIKRARRAVKLINPAPTMQEECLELAFHSIAEIQLPCDDVREMQRKETKKAARQVVAALRRAKAAAGELPGIVEAALLQDELNSRLEPMLQRFSAIANAKSGPPKRTDGEGKLMAAQKAFQLMRAYGLETPVTRSGTFCRLAAELYGDRRADLQHQCRAVRSAQNKG